MSMLSSVAKKLQMTHDVDDLLEPTFRRLLVKVRLAHQVLPEAASDQVRIG